MKVQEREQHDLEARIKCYEEERIEFEKERANWKEELDQARQEIIEQNDRLTVLSEQLAGRKVCGGGRARGHVRCVDVKCGQWLSLIHI